MHVAKLLQKLLFAVDVKDVGLRLPEPFAWTEIAEVTIGMRSVPAANGETAHPFPAVQKSSHVARISHPKQRVDVVRHDHEADALGCHRLELMVEHAQDDALGLIQIKEAPAAIEGEGDEMNVPLIDEFSTLVTHEPDFRTHRASTQLAGEFDAS